MEREEKANIGDKGLDGMYGHIDRIAGLGGSLLNRFSDRFGSGRTGRS